MLKVEEMAGSHERHRPGNHRDRQRLACYRGRRARLCRSRWQVRMPRIPRPLKQTVAMRAYLLFTVAPTRPPVWRGMDSKTIKQDVADAARRG